MDEPTMNKREVIDFHHALDIAVEHGLRWEQDLAARVESTSDWLSYVGPKRKNFYLQRIIDLLLLYEHVHYVDVGPLTSWEPGDK